MSNHRPSSTGSPATSKSDKADKCYTCQVCDRGFKQRRSYVLHKKACVKAFTCDLCHEKFTKKLDLIRHLKSCDRNDAKTVEPSSYKCKCWKVFKRKENLLRHQLTCGKKNVAHVCHICKKDLPNSMELIKHVGQCRMWMEETKNGQLVFSCQKCNQKFTDETSFGNHLQQCDSAPDSHICQHCGKRFSDRSLLKHHSRKYCVHTAPKFEHPHYSADYSSVVCSCKQTFNSRNDFHDHCLQEHVEKPRHANNDDVSTPYKCKVCPEPFRHSRLESHMLSHCEQERNNTREENVPDPPYVCKICSATCANRFAFKRHFKKQHLSILNSNDHFFARFVVILFEN